MRKNAVWRRSAALGMHAVLFSLGALTPQTAAEEPIAAGTAGRNRIDRQEYVWAPPGGFQMGCVPGDDECDKDEKPRHGVTISEGFWMSRTETTVGAYEAFSHESGHPLPPPPEFNPDWRDKNHPIVRVQWEEAVSFCAWAGGRLPTEAEFEYAMRGGYEGLKYPWGSRITRADANYRDVAGPDKWEHTAPAGSFPANSYGLHDLSGNVWEWTADWYGSFYYGISPEADPAGPPRGVERVLRGGSWFNPPRVLRASHRFKYVPAAMDNSLGFRCVLDALP